MSHDELNGFLSPENGQFYLVKSSILRKAYPTCNFELLILLFKLSINQKITKRLFIIQFKVSKNDANSICLMSPLQTIVSWEEPEYGNPNDIGLHI